MSDPVKAPKAAALKAELLKEKARLEAELLPHRQFYEAHVNDPQYLLAKAKIKEINQALFPILNELAALVKPSAKASINAEAGSYTSN